jgi:hypothetical protein
MRLRAALPMEKKRTFDVRFIGTSIELSLKMEMAAAIVEKLYAPLGISQFRLVN